MKKLGEMITSLLLLTAAYSYGQSDLQYYYYYKGERVALEPDRQTIALTWEASVTSQSPPSLRSNYSIVSSMTEDHTRHKVVVIDQKAQARQALKTYYQEVSKTTTSSLSEYEKEIAAYQGDPFISMAAPCFKSLNGERIGLSDKLFLRLRSAADLKILYEQASALGIEILGHNRYMPLWFTLSCGRGTKMNAMTAANKLYETGLFERAEPSFISHNVLNSVDAYYGFQWGLNNTGQFGGTAGIDIRAPQAWAITTGSSSIRTAVFDTGFEMDHPDLQANVFGAGFDSYTGNSPSVVYDKHGTACAGILAAVQNNSIGISGVAPSSKIFSVSFKPGEDIQGYADGFNWAWQNGADVISNSWFNELPSSIVDEAIENALTHGRDGKGSVVVFSIGNFNTVTTVYPLYNNPLIIAVGAISPCGERKSYTSCDGDATWGSDYGGRLDVMAPISNTTTDMQGADGYNAGVDGHDVPHPDYTKKFGRTSSACPVVAGVAALILSANPNLDVHQVKSIIESTAQKVRTDLYEYTNTTGRPNGTWHNQMGYGLVNAYDAVRLALSSCADIITVTTDVPSPRRSDTQVAYSSIVASNNINSGIIAWYGAGKTVTLSNGFHAFYGSSFHAIIDAGCGGTFPVGFAGARMATNTGDNNVKYDYQNNLNASATATLDEEPVGISIFPNPSSGMITLQVSLEQAENTSFKISDMMGNKIYDSPAEIISDKRYEINMGSQSPGIYVLQLTTGNSRKQMKFVMK